MNWDGLLHDVSKVFAASVDLQNGTDGEGAPREAGQNTSRAGASWHIAVVDDEAEVCKSLGRLFRSVGFEVETFLSGQQFLESLRQRQPDCLILDLQMPSLTGLDVQRDLVATGMRFPVIVITGRDEPGLGEKVRTAGGAAFLLKPVNDSELLGTIGRLLRTHE